MIKFKVSNLTELTDLIQLAKMQASALENTLKLIEDFTPTCEIDIEDVKHSISKSKNNEEFDLSDYLSNDKKEDFGG